MLADKARRLDSSDEQYKKVEGIINLLENKNYSECLKVNNLIALYGDGEVVKAVFLKQLNMNWISNIGIMAILKIVENIIFLFLKHGNMRKMIIYQLHFMISY